MESIEGVIVIKKVRNDLKNVYNIAYNCNFQHSQHSAFNSYILHLINWLVNHLTNFLTIVI